jgi:hypothetical protein
MVIVNRNLKFETESGEKDIPIKIYLPIQQNDDSWQCEYEIGWPAEVRKSKAFGIDSIQALSLAMQKIGSEIYTSDAHRSGKLMWLKRKDGYGFPLPSGIRDLYEGADRLL